MTHGVFEMLKIYYYLMFNMSIVANYFSQLFSCIFYLLLLRNVCSVVFIRVINYDSTTKLRKFYYFILCICIVSNN